MTWAVYIKSENFGGCTVAAVGNTADDAAPQIGRALLVYLNRVARLTVKFGVGLGMIEALITSNRAISRMVGHPFRIFN
jgi:hypothetical protein